MQQHTSYLGAALALCFTATGCADEIVVFESPAEREASLLIGSWEWPIEVSRLEVDVDLHATQTSELDSPGASPSSYTMTPLNDGVVALEGWLANAPCEPDVACDEGRAYQRHHMSYHVDEEHFIPFALLRKSGSPGTVGGAGAGVFEGFGVEETRLATSGAIADDGFRAIETRWRLSLDADGAWRSTLQRTDLAGDGGPFEDLAASGTWTLADDGRLTLHGAGASPTQNTLWKGDVVALNGLIFVRKR